MTQEPFGSALPALEVNSSAQRRVLTSCILQQFVGYNKCIKLPGLDMAELTLTLKLPFYRLKQLKRLRLSD
jgi:hypothetical protein